MNSAGVGGTYTPFTYNTTTVLSNLIGGTAEGAPTTQWTTGSSPLSSQSESFTVSNSSYIVNTY